MFTTNTDKISPHLKILSHETLHLSVLSQNDDSFSSVWIQYHINLLVTSMFAFWITEDTQNTIMSLTTYGVICNIDLFSTCDL